MTMNNIIAIGSENVRSAAAAAWSQIRSYAVSLPEPQKGRASGFLPSELCYNAINAAVKEYPEKVVSPLLEPRRQFLIIFIGFLSTTPEHTE
jgi:hypothetical protein